MTVPLVTAQVVVVGAGPVGLAVCAGLAHHGVAEVVLLDPRPGAERESRAFGVWARTCETLRDWGLFDELRDRGTFATRLQPVDGTTGRRLFRFDFGVLDPVSPTAGVLIAPQYLTEQVLHGHVAAATGTRIFAATVETLIQDEDGVTVTARRPDGTTMQVRGRFLVGCDGAHSTVRHQVGQRLEGRTYPTRMVLADVAPDSDAGLGPMRFASRHPGFLAGVRFDDRRWRVMATLDDESGVSGGDPADPQAWQARLHALFPDRRVEILWSSEFRLYRRAVARFRIGRVLLAGDAAHLISPAGGQGMNSGIQDAENLAWKLAATLAGGDEESLLDSYDVERRGLIVTDVGRTAEWTQRIEFGMPTWGKPTLLGLLDLAARVPPVAARLARGFSMLGHRYPTSPLLRGEHRLLGTRIDDPRLADGQRLSDHLRGRAALITIDPRPPDDTPVPLPHLPPGLPRLALPCAPRSWHLTAPAALIVRPDRHVGAILTTAAEASDNAARWALDLGAAALGSPRRVPGDGDRDWRAGRRLA